MKQLFILAALAAASTLSLTACGSSEPGTEAGEEHKEGEEVPKGPNGADSDDGAHVFRSDGAQRSDLIARR